MDPNPQEAAELLAGADRTQRRVMAGVPRDERVFLAWGLFYLLALPGYDVFGDGPWALVVIGVAALVSIATSAYYSRGRSRVRLTAPEQPRWTWWTMTAGGLIAWGVSSATGSFTLAGVLGALPPLATAAWLRSR